MQANNVNTVRSRLRLDRDHNGNNIPVANHTNAAHAHLAQNVRNLTTRIAAPGVLDDEPTFSCLTCGQGIPVHDSGTHRSLCYYSTENDCCPICDRKRNHRIMEAHIFECAARKDLPMFETIKTVAEYKSSTDVLDRVVAKERDLLIKRYRIALYAGNESPFFPCGICGNRRDHDQGLCLAILGGTILEEEAHHAYNREVLPGYSTYIDMMNDERKVAKLETFESRWEEAHPGVPYDPERMFVVMEDYARRCDDDKERRIRENRQELDRVIERNNNVLGRKLIYYRDRFAQYLRNIRRGRFFQN